MNPALLVALFALAPTSHPPPQRPPPVEQVAHDGYEVGCARDIDDAFAALDAALVELAGDVDSVRGRDRRRLRDDLADVVAAAQHAREHACRATPVVVVPPPPAPPPPRAIVLDDVTHRQIVSAMQHEGFDDGKLRIVDTAVRGEMCVTAPQVRDFMKTLSFSGNRLDVLRRLAPRLVDDGQAIVIFRVLDFESDKDDARELLASRRTIAACRLPLR